jgi:hypothetical protein
MRPPWVSALARAVPLIMRALTLGFSVLVVALGSNEMCESSNPNSDESDTGRAGAPSVVIKLVASKDVWHRSQYYGPVYIGTPPKRFLLLVDTGSFDVSVQGHTCTTCYSGNSYGLCADSSTAAACAATLDSSRAEGRSVTGRHVLCNESKRCSHDAADGGKAGTNAKCDPLAADDSKFCKFVLPAVRARRFTRTDSVWVTFGRTDGAAVRRCHQCRRRHQCRHRRRRRPPPPPPPPPPLLLLLLWQRLLCQTQTTTLVHCNRKKIQERRSAAACAIRM